MEESKSLRLESTKKKLEKLQKELEILIDKERRTYDRNEEREISHKINQVFCEIDRARSEIHLLENNPVASNETLDIYLEEGSIEEKIASFGIYLHGTSTRIGRVSLRSDFYESLWLGNVGYGLDEEYQGHRFMLQSLELLKETMIRMKIYKPVITVEPNNEPSIHTIKNFGGVLIQPHDGKKIWYDTYEVDLMADEAPKKK